MADIGNIKNFFVTWFDASASTPYSVSEDITDEVLAISFTDTGSGQVNECVLKVSGAFGRFISDSSNPTVTVSGGGGMGATATAVTSGGSLIAVNVSNPGTAYTSTPTVTLSGGGATVQGTATAIVVNEQVTSYIVNTSGSGYDDPQTVFKQFDRFRVQAEDLVGNTYERYFEFNPVVIPSETKSEGTLLELNLIGIEYHTQRITFSGRFWFANAFDVARAIGQSYNENSNLIPNNIQPVLTGHTLGYDQLSGVGNGFPKFTVNHYEYGLVEDSGYNRWNQMLDKLGGSVANGGVLDYFDIGFETSDVSAIEIALFSQGSRTIDINDDANIPTLIQPVTGDDFKINIGSTDVGIVAATATQVAAWGAQTRGSLPTGHSKYVSGKDQFIFRPSWDANIPFQKDSLVKYLDNEHFRALNDITSFPADPPPVDVTNWEQIDMSDEFGDTIQYSEWTDDKVKEWANSGANPRDVNQTNHVTAAVINSKGSGFTSATVLFSGGGGSGATGTVLVKKGVVESITITNGGTGFTSAPTATISGDGAGATATSIIGSIITPDTDNGKIGASMFDINIVVLDNRKGGSFFRTWVDFRLRDTGGRVSLIVVDDAGSGYVTVPAVAITGGGGSGATAEAVLDNDGTIALVNVTSGGTGYTSTPTVTIDPPGAGTQATADATISTGESISVAADNWAYSGQDNQFPIGRRMLVDGIATGFTGTDVNGIPFENNICEWDGEKWIVKYRPSDTGNDLIDMQVVIIDEGLIYQWDTTDFPNQWGLVTGDLAVDCLHQYTSISSVESFDPDPTLTDSVNHPDVTKDGNIFDTNIDSAIEFNYEIGTNFLDRLQSGSGTPLGDFFKKGAWAVFRVPFSPNNYGSPSVTLGNVFGKEFNTEPDVGIDRFQPAFLDTQNMTFTSRGTRGFVQDNSEDLGQLQELAAIIKITSKTVANTDLLGPNVVRIWMIDRYDNTVYYDIEIPFVDTFYPVAIPLSSFKIYRGFKPRFFDLALNNIANLLIPQELELYNRFAFREVQLVGFQIQNFYDEFGRYAPDISGDGLDFDIDNTSLAKTIGGRLAITIDDFHFTKPLLAIARQGENLNLETQFKKRPHIITFKQLLNDASTELQKEQFQLRQFEIETAGERMFDLKFGDSFFFENPRLVDLQDDSTNPSAKKIKLVARHIQYNFTAPGTGEGGLTRTLTSVKRFL